MNIKNMAKQIIEGNFNQKEFDKIYDQGASVESQSNAQELSREVAYLVKEDVSKSENSNKEEVLVEKLKNVSDFLLSLNDSDFSFALNTLKNDLSTIPELCEHTSENLSKSVRENIAINIYNNDKCKDSQRSILINVVSDFSKYSVKSSLKV